MFLIFACRHRRPPTPPFVSFASFENFSFGTIKYFLAKMAAISSSEQPQMQQIDLMKLNLQQLHQLKNQLDQVNEVKILQNICFGPTLIRFQELTIFNDSLTTLKMAKNKYAASRESLEQIKDNWDDKTCLIPLTGSMYVPGRIKDTNNVIVDIGTGYYIEEDRESAKDYFKRKVDFVMEQMEKIEILGFEKSQIRDAICDVIAIKIQQMKAAMSAEAPQTDRDRLSIVD